MSEEKKTVEETTAAEEQQPTPVEETATQQEQAPAAEVEEIATEEAETTTEVEEAAPVVEKADPAAVPDEQLMPAAAVSRPAQTSAKSVAKTEEATEEETDHVAYRKQRVGLVTSNKMDKTIAVEIQRRLQHPIYGKYVKKSKKLIAHDEANECSIGDTVRVEETRPLSRRKRWRLVEVIEKVK